MSRTRRRKAAIMRGNRDDAMAKRIARALRNHPDRDLEWICNWVFPGRFFPAKAQGVRTVHKDV